MMTTIVVAISQMASTVLSRLELHSIMSQKNNWQMPRLTMPREGAGGTDTYRYEASQRKLVGWFSPEPPSEPEDVRLWVLKHADVPPAVKAEVGRRYDLPFAAMTYGAAAHSIRYVYAHGRMVLSYP